MRRLIVVAIVLFTSCVLVPIDRKSVILETDSDAGDHVIDAGELDAGNQVIDAGEHLDAGDQAVDAGKLDAGELDAGDLDASQLDPDGGVDTSDGGLTTDAGYDGGSATDAGQLCANVQADWGGDASMTCSESPDNCHQAGGECDTDPSQPYLCCCVPDQACYLSD